MNSMIDIFTSNNTSSLIGQSTGSVGVGPSDAVVDVDDCIIVVVTVVGVAFVVVEIVLLLHSFVMAFVTVTGAPVAVIVFVTLAVAVLVAVTITVFVVVAVIVLETVAVYVLEHVRPSIGSLTISSLLTFFLRIMLRVLMKFPQQLDQIVRAQVTIFVPLGITHHIAIPRGWRCNNESGEGEHIEYGDHDDVEQ